MDLKTKHLYCITTDDYERTAIDLHEDNIVRYPFNIGLTGLAIKNKQIIVSQLGQRDRQFAPEVDNYMNFNKIGNILIGPMVDKNGQVMGVLQLMNKMGSDERITEQDQNELASLLPALGEIIRTADESMEITRLSYGKHIHKLIVKALKTSLRTITNSVFDSKNEIGTNNLAMLDQMIKSMST